MLCTINDIRVRLGKIMINLMDNEINEKFRSINFLYPEKIALKYDIETDEFVIELSKNLYDKDYLKNKILSAKQEVFFTFFLRYHILTNELINRDQTLPANVPENDEDFFIVLMNSLWKSL